MRRLATVLVILLQLGPLAGAGICMHAERAPKAECPMPMPGMPDHNQQPPSGGPQDCALMALCAPAAPMVPVALQTLVPAPPPATDYTSPATLLSGDPVAPPQPPPIA